MIRYEKRIRFLAAGLSALAGFVDATGFLKLGGFFVSFMSGNTTRLAVELAAGVPAAAIAVGLVALFVMGVMAGTLVGHTARHHRPAVILILVAVLLATAALLGTLGLAQGAVITMTLAMGAENAVFTREGEVQIGLTYMTGTLVKLGQRLTAALLGGGDTGWTSCLLLWLGLTAGAVAGATLYPWLGLNNLWLAAAAAAGCAALAARPGWTLEPR